MHTKKQIKNLYDREDDYKIPQAEVDKAVKAYLDFIQFMSDGIENINHKLRVLAKQKKYYLSLSSEANLNQNNIKSKFELDLANTANQDKRLALQTKQAETLLLSEDKAKHDDFQKDVLACEAKARELIRLRSSTQCFIERLQNPSAYPLDVTSFKSLLKAADFSNAKLVKEAEPLSISEFVKSKLFASLKLKKYQFRLSQYEVPHPLMKLVEKRDKEISRLNEEISSKIILGMKITHLKQRYESSLNEIQEIVNYADNKELFNKNFPDHKDIKNKLFDSSYCVIGRVKEFIKSFNHFGQNGKLNHAETSFKHQLLSILQNIDIDVVRKKLREDLNIHAELRRAGAELAGYGDNLKNSYRHSIFFIHWGASALEEINIAKKFAKAIDQGDLTFSLTKREYWVLTHSNLGGILKEYKPYHIFPEFIVDNKNLHNKYAYDRPIESVRFERN